MQLTHVEELSLQMYRNPLILYIFLLMLCLRNLLKDLSCNKKPKIFPKNAIPRPNETLTLIIDYLSSYKLKPLSKISQKTK